MTQLMVEIFKTNVTDPKLAKSALRALGAQFAGCHANFDLDDCDHILRVEFPGDPVPAQMVIAVLNAFGATAEVLDDIVPMLRLTSPAPAEPDAPPACNANSLCSTTELVSTISC